MFLEQMLNEHSFFVYSKGYIYTKGSAPNNIICKKNKNIQLSQKKSFFDLRNKEQGNYLNLETCMKKVIIPYLEGSMSERINSNKRFFPRIGENKALYISKDQAVILKQDSTKDPLLILDSVKYSKDKYVSVKETIQRFRHAEKKNLRKYYDYSCITSKRKVSLINRLPDFKMKNSDNEVFHFSGVRNCIDIRFEGGRYVFSDPYDSNKTNHPFIYTSGDICIGKKEFIQDLNIKMNYERIDEKFVRDFCSYFLHSRSVLLKGYQSGAAPVKALDKDNFKVEYRRGRQ